MTIIEFFDKADINNIAGALIYEPEKVILVGSCNEEMMKSIEDYRKVLSSRFTDTVVEHKKIDSNNLSEVYNRLVEIVEENKDCVFDIAGGDDLFLVAVGMVAERFKERIQLHRIDAGKNTVIDCDAATNICEEIPISISVDEIISLYGGKVIYNDEKSDGTVEWDFSDDFISDLKKMWDIFRNDIVAWNTQINELDYLRGQYQVGSDLSVKIDKEKAKVTLKKRFGFFKLSHDFFRSLSRAGLILDYDAGWETGVYAFRFKNGQVMRCLTKAGQLLEIYTTFIARGLVIEKNNFFTDYATGVYIDWDGKLEVKGKADIHNEIDIILMKGFVPVFISCKSGDVKIEELYKLSSVADRFGGPYVKKVLLCTRLNRDKDEAEIKARAKEMGIVIIDGVGKMGITEFRKNLCMIWNN